MSSTSFAERITSLSNVSGTIAEALAELIFSGKLRPGERLVQSRLAEEFGVSRVPVRDALHLLERRSLVVTRPRRGVVVRPVSRRGMHEIFAVRRILEPPAMEEVVANVTEEDLARLEEIVDLQARALQQGDVESALKQDQRFHDSINSHISNSLLREMIQIVWTRNRQVRSVMRSSERGRDIGYRSVARHRQLLAAMRDRDVDRARAVLLETIDAAEGEILGELQQLRWFEDGT